MLKIDPITVLILSIVHQSKGKVEEIRVIIANETKSFRIIAANVQAEEGIISGSIKRNSISYVEGSIKTKKETSDEDNNKKEIGHLIDRWDSDIQD